MTELRTRPVTEDFAKLNWKCPATKSHPEGPFYCEGSICPWWRFENLGVSGEYPAPVGWCGGASRP